MPTDSLWKMSRPEIIFVLGLQKTGLGSLAAMFEKAGYYRTRSRKASHIRNEVLRNVTSGEQPKLDSYFSNDTLFVDWPAPLLYRDAYERFGPRARYILSMRSSAQKWLDSLKTHSLTFQPKQNKHQQIYGHKYPHGHEEEHIAYYERHNEAVQTFFYGGPAAELYCEVCVEDRSSVLNMLRFLDLEGQGLENIHTNSGKERLKKFSLRKKYNSYILKMRNALKRAEG